MAKDYYADLGVDSDASDETIRKAYRKLAMKFHPDRAKSDDEKKTNEAKFKKISEAYNVLSSPEKRQQYDQFGDVDGMAGFGGGGRGFGDIFGDILGGAFRGQGFSSSAASGQHGEDLVENVQITLPEMLKGSERELRYNTLEQCGECEGEGTDPNAEITTCQHCQGSGMLRNNMGIMMMQQTCHHCGGRGKSAPPCKTCNGEARVQKSKKLSIKIQPGIDDGQTLRVRGQGCEGTGLGSPGDLLVRISVAADPVFTRQGDDLHCELPISLKQALIGDTVNLQLVDSEVAIKIKPGIQPNGRLRLAGKGVPRLEEPNRRGDLICTVKVHLPNELTAKQTAKFKAFDETLSSNQREGKKTMSDVLDGAKKLFGIK